MMVRDACRIDEAHERRLMRSEGARLIQFKESATSPIARLALRTTQVDQPMPPHQHALTLSPATSTMNAIEVACM
jgi:hypothetical protein